MKPLLDPVGASPFIGAEIKTMANWRYQGIGPRWVRVGGRVKYDPDDIAEWRERQRVSSTSQKAAV